MTIPEQRCSSLLFLSHSAAGRHQSSVSFSCWLSAAAPLVLRVLSDIPEQFFTQGWGYVRTCLFPASGHGQLIQVKQQHLRPRSGEL